MKIGKALKSISLPYAILLVAGVALIAASFFFRFTPPPSQIPGPTNQHPGNTEIENLPIVGKSSDFELRSFTTGTFIKGRVSRRIFAYMEMPVNGWVDFEAHSDRAGKFTVALSLAFAPHLGQIRILLNGKEIAVVDEYRPDWEASGPILVGPVEVKAGKNILRLQGLAPSHPQTPASPNVGITFDAFRMVDAN